jgi:hypothetical protein
MFFDRNSDKLLKVICLYLILLCVILGISSLHATIAYGQTQDITPPQLIGPITINPSSIDVSDSAGIVTITILANDDLSGLGGGSYVSITRPLTNLTGWFFFSPIGGDQFEANVDIPRYSANGTYNIEKINLMDNAGNGIQYSTVELQSMGFDTNFEVTSDLQDIEAPIVKEVRILPNEIDVSSSDQVIEIELDLLDQLSGINPSKYAEHPFQAVHLISPSGKQERFEIFSELILESCSSANGVCTEGTWKALIEMPQYSETGLWRIDGIQLRDLAFNKAWYPGPDKYLVVNSSSYDINPPQLVGFDYFDKFINTSIGGKLITLNLDVTDDLSGADFSERGDVWYWAYLFGVKFISPSGNQTNWTVREWHPFTLISGDPWNGRWQATCHFPQFSEQGTWKVEHIHIKDRVRNILFLDTDDLQDMGFPTDLIVIKPSLSVDGEIDNNGGTVVDDIYGEQAQVSFGPGDLTEATDVSIDVLEEPLEIPTPAGFISPGTHFTNIQLTPDPKNLPNQPDMEVSLPLVDPAPVTPSVNLFEIDPTTSSLIPATDSNGNPVIGPVDSDMGSANFTCLAKSGTMVGLTPDVITVSIDIKPGSDPNCFNINGHGVIPVAILGNSNFDVTQIDPITVMFAGLDVGIKGNAAPQCSFEDVSGDFTNLNGNADGYLDMVCQFIDDPGKWAPDSGTATLTGSLLQEYGGNKFLGTDSICLTQ